MTRHWKPAIGPCSQTKKLDMECTKIKIFKIKKKIHVFIIGDRIYSPQCKHHHQEDGCTQAYVWNGDVKENYADLPQQAVHQ